MDCVYRADQAVFLWIGLRSGDFANQVVFAIMRPTFDQDWLVLPSCACLEACVYPVASCQSAAPMTSPRYASPSGQISSYWPDSGEGARAIGELAVEDLPLELPAPSEKDTLRVR